MPRHKKPDEWGKRIVASLLLPLCLTACDALDSEADVKTKETLLGSWYFDYKDSSERLFKNVVTLTDGGTFSAREQISGESREEKSSGLWYVTDGIFKLQTNEIDGKKLGTRSMLFFTCKLSDVRSKEFVCDQENGKYRFNFRRVLSDFSLS